MTMDSQQFAHDLLTRAGADPRTGMLLPRACTNCGRLLNADGGHPAELYLGTYTGLCDDCVRAGPFTVTRFGDVAAVSHPPHAPSWRRNRESYLHWLGCAAPRCQWGRIMIDRRDAAPEDAWAALFVPLLADT